MGERTKHKPQPDVALKTRFGANVKNHRRRLGMSQEQLAWRANMHRTYLADIERGSRNISLFSIVRLVNALGTSLADFFFTLEEDFRAPLAIAPRRKRKRPSVVGKRTIRVLGEKLRTRPARRA